MTNLTCPISDVAPLLPHSGEMVLLDRILEFGEDFLLAEASVTANHILLQNGRLPILAGLEIMAQGVAAWAGCMATLANEPVRLGYLLGTRKLHIYRQHIEIGTPLQIRVKMSIQDTTGFGVFDCELVDLTENECLLAGALNVFSPKEEKK